MKLKKLPLILMNMCLNIDSVPSVANPDSIAMSIYR